MSHRHVTICTGNDCQRFGAGEILASVEKSTAGDERVKVVTCPCLGYCSSAPNVIVGHEMLHLTTAEQVLKRLVNAPLEEGNEGRCCQETVTRTGAAVDVDSILGDNNFLGDL